MANFVRRHDDPIMSITIGTFNMQINQRYVASMSAKKRKHFWTVVEKKLKEEDNGNQKKRRQ